MLIGITVNNTLRNHIPKLENLYRSMMNDEPQNLPVNPYDLVSHFPAVVSSDETTEFVGGDEDTDVEWKSSDVEFDVHQLMYMDASFEIFGSAEETEAGIIKKISEMPRGVHQFSLTNLESPTSKRATLFFLSKTFFDMPDIQFPASRGDMWSKFDVLITDDPKLLALKPADKISVKVETIWNKSVDSDITINNIIELVDNHAHVIEQIEKADKKRWLTNQ